MKVVYIGNFRPQFSTENEVAHALRVLGHDVIEVQEDECPWLDLGLMAKLNDAAFILWTHTHDYASGDTEALCFEMIADAQQNGIPTVSYHLDKWWGLERQWQAISEPFFRTDLVVTADGGHADEWAAHDINHVWLPPAVSERWCHRGEAQSRYRKDVVFVGNWQAYGHADVWPWRHELVTWLQRNYGSRFRSYPRNGVTIRGDELCDVYASAKVVVGDSCLANGATRYWSDRVPETLGRGGFLIHPYVDGLDEWYGGELPWTFNVGDFASLRSVIDEALLLPEGVRLNYTEMAMQHAREHHTYTVRMRQVIEMVEAL